MKALTRISLVTVLTLLLALPVLGQDDLEDETLLMTFIPNVQFSPMYAAIAEGYFADAGFRVSLEYLNEPDVVDLVAANQNNFGVVSGEQVILAASQGRPIVYVYEWFQEYPIGIVYSSDMTLDSASDLAGLTVGIPGRFGATYSGFNALAASGGIAESDVRLEEIGFAAPEVFCVGRVEASVIYVNNEPLQINNLAKQGECGDVSSVNVLRVADEIDLVSNGIITSESMIDENPEKVTAFVGAYNAGLASVINNPAHAYLISSEFVEGLPLDDELRVALETLADEQDVFLATEPTHEEIAASRADILSLLSQDFDADTLIQMQVLLTSIELWDAEQLGFSDLAAWENMQNTLLSLEQIREGVDLESIFTNDFLPEAE